MKSPDEYARRAEDHLRQAGEIQDPAQQRYHLDAAAILAQLALAAATTRQDERSHTASTGAPDATSDGRLTHRMIRPALDEHGNPIKASDIYTKKLPPRE